MTRTRRILFEVFAPPFLAAIILDVMKSRSEGIVVSVLGFPPFLLFVYVYAIVPSAVYAFLMEHWFRADFHIRYGLFGTALISAVLGLASGTVVQLEAQGTLGSPLPWIGALSGLITGMYLGWRLNKTKHHDLHKNSNV